MKKSSDSDEEEEGANPESSPMKKAEPVYNKEYALEPISAGKELPNIKTKIGQAILNQVVKEMCNNILEEQKKMQKQIIEMSGLKEKMLDLNDKFATDSVALRHALINAKE